MGEWREVSLGKVSDMASGKARTSEADGAYPLFGSNGVIGASNESLREAAIIVGRVGAYCGSLRISKQPFWATDNTIVVEPTEDVDLVFLHAALTAGNLAGLAGGSAQPLINQARLKALSLWLPDRATQRRIAAVLSAFDDLIEINERRIELLEDLARSLYREWFVRFRFPGHGTTAGPDAGAMHVPSGWELLSLRDVVETKYGYTATGASEPVGPKFLRGTDINKRSFINWNAVPYCLAEAEARAKFALEVGDICVIRMADPGKVGIVEHQVDAVFASYLVRMRSTDERLPPYLLFHHLDAEPYQSWISGSSTGATRKSASASVLTEPKVPLPTLEVAQMFTDAVSPIRSELAKLVQSCEALAATRDLLLPRLVTGRLEIDDVDLGDLLTAEAA